MNGYPESADWTVPPKGMAATAVAPPGLIQISFIQMRS